MKSGAECTTPRAGRQGDPGRSRFFISREDDLLVKYGIGDEKLGHAAESIQRLVTLTTIDDLWSDHLAAIGE
jgi:preprotein translocase subunit SecA